jgi:hypothetical protein
MEVSIVRMDRNRWNVEIAGQEVGAWALLNLARQLIDTAGQVTIFLDEKGVRVD